MAVFYYKIVKFVNEHNKSFLTRQSTTKQSNASDRHLDKAPELTVSVVSEIETLTERETACKFAAASKPHVEVIHVKPADDSHPMETLSFRNVTPSDAYTGRLSQVISPSPSENSCILPHGQRSLKGQRRLHLQEKLVKILLATVLALQICWLPSL